MNKLLRMFRPNTLYTIHKPCVYSHQWRSGCESCPLSTIYQQLTHARIYYSSIFAHYPPTICHCHTLTLLLTVGIPSIR